MEKSMLRAVRRHHYARLKNSRKHYFNFSWWANQAKRLGIIAYYPTKCSCPMCGNPRKWFGDRTISECRDDYRYVDGMNDLLDNE